MLKNQTKEIKKLSSQIDELDSKFKRTLADYQNLEKRQLQDRENLIKFTNQSLLDKLLPLLDDLQRAQDHLKDTGLNHVLTQFTQLLESEGVKEIKSTGEIFDPQIMDCVEAVPGKENHVIKTLIKGYLYRDRVLRPARVEVGNDSVSKITN
jgi:molecular chaperone GrpE